MSYVVITGFFLGFQNFLLEQLINNDAHIHITPQDKYLTEHGLDHDFFGDSVAHIFWNPPPSGQVNSTYVEDPSSWFKRLKADPRVEAFGPILSKQMLFRQSKSTVAGTLVGCDPKAQAEVSNLEESIKNGRLSDLNYGGNLLLIGEGLMNKLGARVSQTVYVLNDRGISTPFKIVGMFKTGMKPIDDTRAYGKLADVQQAASAANQINDIGVRLYDYTQASTVADSWSRFEKEKVQSWDQINENFLAVFNIQNATRYLMIAVLLIVASFGIYNVLSMTVTQKRQEIAILRSMGFDSLDVVNLFFYQGLILGLIGGLIGLVFGYWICLYLQTIPFGGGPMGGSGYLKVSLNPMIYLQAMLLALLSSCLASILPARSAGRLTPIEIIRHGA